jgi:uncharacterized coiled-coil DUF342 family protein
MKELQQLIEQTNELSSQFKKWRKQIQASSQQLKDSLDRCDQVFKSGFQEVNAQIQDIQQTLSKINGPHF